MTKIRYSTFEVLQSGSHLKFCQTYLWGRKDGGKINNVFSPFLQVVEIIIGIVELFFGIGTAFNAITISIYSGVMFWGAIIVRFFLSLHHIMPPLSNCAGTALIGAMFLVLSAKCVI